MQRGLGRQVGKRHPLIHAAVPNLSGSEDAEDGRWTGGMKWHRIEFCINGDPRVPTCVALRLVGSGDGGDASHGVAWRGSWEG